LARLRAPALSWKSRMAISRAIRTGSLRSGWARVVVREVKAARTVASLEKTTILIMVAEVTTKVKCRKIEGRVELYIRSENHTPRLLRTVLGVSIWMFVHSRVICFWPNIRMPLSTPPFFEPATYIKKDFMHRLSYSRTIGPDLVNRRVLLVASIKFV